MPTKGENTKDEGTEPSSSSSFSPFSSLSSWFQQFHDDQRMERLQHCRQLDEILKSCRGASNQHHEQQQQREDSSASLSPTTSSEKTILDIEGCSQGLRMMKYFGWRGILLPIDDDDSSNNDTDKKGNKNNKNDDYYVDQKQQNKIHNRIKSTCSREEHSVWACRAVATGCGRELSELRSCFNKEGPFNVLTAPIGGYEKLKNTSSKLVTKDDKKLILPCHDLQLALGNCVNKNGQELYDRRKKMRRKAAATAN